MSKASARSARQFTTSVTHAHTPAGRCSESAPASQLRRRHGSRDAFRDLNDRAKISVAKNETLCSRERISHRDSRSIYRRSRRPKPTVQITRVWQKIIQIDRCCRVVGMVFITDKRRQAEDCTVFISCSCVAHRKYAGAFAAASLRHIAVTDHLYISRLRKPAARLTHRESTKGAVHVSQERDSRKRIIFICKRKEATSHIAECSWDDTDRIQYKIITARSFRTGGVCYLWIAR